MSTTAVVIFVILVLLLSAAGLVIVLQHRANQLSDVLHDAADLVKTAGAAVDKAEAEVTRSSDLVEAANARERQRKAESRARRSTPPPPVSRQREASEGS